MSKTNDTSKLRIEYAAKSFDLNSVATFTVREFRNDELERVSGGVSKTVWWGYDDESPGFTSKPFVTLARR